MRSRRWTIYLCQDKHLDYNWCGTNQEIEARMTALLDYYLDQSERFGAKWNLDCTRWLDVYRLHRGKAGSDRLLAAIRSGSFGYGANHSVQLWGMMSTEIAIRACLGGVAIERACGRAARTALIMENWGILAGAATVLTECGITRLARGTYPLRAETYHASRDPRPLFWWEAPNGKRLLVYWPMYTDTKSWGGYAEAHRLAFDAGETWNAYDLVTVGDRNTDEVFAGRCDFIDRTVQRHESLEAAYPVRSIMLLGTGWDNWTMTDDYRCFIDRYNSASDGSVTLVDARYDEYFEAVETEIEERSLSIPTVRGSFGITWEEWPAHLAGSTAEYREAARLLAIGEAKSALTECDAPKRKTIDALLETGYDGLMRFLEHDFGGATRHLAAISAGVRAAAATQAGESGAALLAEFEEAREETTFYRFSPSHETTFAWNGGRVEFSRDRLGITAITAAGGGAILRSPSTDGRTPLFGELLVTRFADAPQVSRLFPEVIPGGVETEVSSFESSECDGGVVVRSEGTAWGFRISAEWFLPDRSPYIDLTYRLEGGWDHHARSVQIGFPVAIGNPEYRYDTAGAILQAGPAESGGDDLPGANPELFAAWSFAEAGGSGGGGSGGRGGRGGRGGGRMLVISPDAYLFQFGPGAVRTPGYDADRIGCMITSMPLMNLTRQDHQVNQGGRASWRFRYRIVFGKGGWDPVHAIAEAAGFGTAPYLWTPRNRCPVGETESLEIDFPGGPLVSVRRLSAESGEDDRLVLRFWNAAARPVAGSFALPKGYSQAEYCDALDRPKQSIPVRGSRLEFEADHGAIVTIALQRRR